MPRSRDADELAVYILSRLHFIPITGCWIWDGSDSGNGYGKVRHNGRSRVVHRVLYELLVGPVPRTILLDHSCRIRLCCNPAHLEPVTPLVNTLRGNAVLFRPIRELETA